MGGSESLLTGLNNLDKFAWVGAFSAGGLPDPFDKDFPGLLSHSDVADVAEVRPVPFGLANLTRHDLRRAP